MNRRSAEPLTHLSVVLAALLVAGLPATLRAQAPSEPATNHKGVFFTLGMGYGSVECGGCTSGGVSPLFEVGGWLSPTVQLGFGTRAWIQGGDGYVDGLVTAGPMLTAYLGRSSRFYFTALAGAATEFEEGIYLGFGGSGTLGVDLSVSRSVTVAPYLSFDFRNIGEESFTGIGAGIALRLP
jgi:hypothetical protein